MTVKELIKNLEEYPETAPVRYALIEMREGEEVDRQLMEFTEVNSDGVHVLLIERN